MINFDSTNYKCFVDGSFTDETIKIVLENTNNVVKFPLDNSNCHNVLIPNMSNAYFGKNNKLVYDETYRSAKVLESNEYFTNFDIENTEIIDKISKTLTDDKFTLKRDKLNVYEKNGFFKMHKDTPKNKNMIGTLIICFPSEFTGGDLVLYTEEKKIFDWSKLSKTHFQWCAFYGDVDHEIEKVTCGNRITMTYTIIKEPVNNFKFNAKSENIKNQLIDILKSPHILPDGGFLNYSCKHLYRSGTNPENIAFKGVDELFYNVCLILNISVMTLDVSSKFKCYYIFAQHCIECEKKRFIVRGVDVNYINSNDYPCQEDEEGVCFECSTKKSVLNKYKNTESYNCFYDVSEIRHDEFCGQRQDIFIDYGKQLTSHMYWLNDPYDNNIEETLQCSINLIYGNEPGVDEEVYRQKGLFLDIPNYEKRCELLKNMNFKHIKSGKTIYQNDSTKVVESDSDN